MTGYPDYISFDTGKITEVQHSCMPSLVALRYKMPLSLCINVCLTYISVQSTESILDFDLLYCGWINSYYTDHERMMEIFHDR